MRHAPRGGGSRRSRLTLCVLLAAAACRPDAQRPGKAVAARGADTVVGSTGDSVLATLAEDSVLRPAGADSAAVAALRVTRDSLDRRLRSDSTLGTERYVRIAMFADSSLRLLDDTARWPDTAFVNLGILTDARGRVRLAHELSAGDRGDWFNAHTHYFDAEGRLFAYERYSRFAVGCPRTARETAVTYVAPSGRTLGRDYALTALDPAERVAKDGCVFPVRWPYTIHRTWLRWATAARVTALLD